MTVKELKPSFSNLQMELLKIYANGISDEQLLEIKWLLGRYFAEKATAAMDVFIENNNISAARITEMSKDHIRRADRY
jgi:hypothetical protein